jgi:Uma2 family endonuclease
METLRLAWPERDFFVGGNMFLYFSMDQVRNRDFRGPDVFIALDVPQGERRSWVVWAENKAPDVVIELLSDSTAEIDRGEKKRVYQDELRVPGYFWYHPWTGELAGFALRDREYHPVEPDEAGRLPCKPLGLALVRWHGSYQGVETDWLRWAYPDGRLLPTPGERAGSELQRADAERERADAEHERAERLAARLRELGEEL